jgi:hypothetical protein
MSIKAWCWGMGAAAVALTAVQLNGCVGECTPGEQTSCMCPGGEWNGLFTCSSNGDYGECDCSGAVPTGGSGGTPPMGGSPPQGGMGGSGGTSCSAPNMVCDGMCVDVMTSADHCGMCNQDCSAADVSCDAGNCICDNNSAIYCGGTCVLAMTDPTNCGGCGHDCLGAACTGGLCTPSVLAANQDEPYALTLSATHIYYGQAGTTNTVHRRLLDGSSEFTIATVQNEPRELVINGSELFWTSFGFGGNTGAVRKWTLGAGTGTQTDVVSGLPVGPWAIAANGDFLYYVNQNTNGVFSKQISTAMIPTTIAVNVGGTPWDIAVNATHVYWSNYASGEIRRATLTGQTPTAVATAQANPVGIAIDATHVYWASETGGEIRRSVLAGGAVDVVATGQNQPTYVAVDATSVYWTSFGAGTVSKAPLAGGTVTLLAAGQAQAYHIGVDATHVYWTTLVASTGAIMRVPK